ncbi:hypothetical protein AVEN_245862-1 [Araneus ventricosus]|uniref:Mutator-like transposase domain-containing protein n=1 Tax=Araneus ventricosus TaxID=182803 RepID=A0A4Y2MFU2_ARAVE|nr:hypothetical protein AVEN_245862-1 [Araneus ventricosus]
MCNSSSNRAHDCVKQIGSSSSLEVVGVYRKFERSEKMRNLQYVKYFGDGDSKSYDNVKDIYGKDNVKKLEYIGHIQKTVGTRLRNLKSKRKGLGGKGKLAESFIDKLQNYYGIAIRRNTNNLDKMQSSVFAAVFHVCWIKSQPVYLQCPTGTESWCKYQRALANRIKYQDKSQGLPKNIMKW